MDISLLKIIWFKKPCNERGIFLKHDIKKRKKIKNKFLKNENSNITPYKENFSSIYPGAVSIFISSIIKKVFKKTSLYLVQQLIKIFFLRTT